MSAQEVVTVPSEQMPAEALRRIRECGRTGQTWLDLGDLRLEELPPELGRLTHLRDLALGKSALRIGPDEAIEWESARGWQQPFRNLHPLATLTDLASLNLAGCNFVSDLTPLRSLSRLTRLSLAECGSLSDLRPLGELRALTRLSLGALPALSDLTPLASLSGLSCLNLGGCKVLSELGPLAGLSRLAWLSLLQCEALTNLGPVGKLAALTKLELGKCWSLSDLGPLKTLSELTELSLPFCSEVSDLRPLRNLTKLERLDLTACSSVSDLRPLRNLTSLQLLGLTRCRQVSDLTPLLDHADLRVLSVEGTAVPLPDHLQRSRDAAAILAWYREMDLAVEKKALGEVKVVLLGQGRVGKTQLRMRLFEGKGIAHHDPTLESTRHVEYAERIADRLGNEQPSREVKLRVWDFGGQNELHSAHRFFLGSQRCFYILVIAADRPANGESGNSSRLNYWLRLIAEYTRRSDGKRPPVLIVVSRSDEELAEMYREDILRALSAALLKDWFGANVVDVVLGFGWSRGLSETTHPEIWSNHESAADSIEFSIRSDLHKVPDLDQEIPLVYHRAKAFAEHAFSPQGIDGDGRTLNCIAGESMARFAKLFEKSKAQATDAQREALRRCCLGFLNSLGIVHWVGDIPEINRENRWNLREIAFNPEWVRRPVYDLIRHADSDARNAGFLRGRQIGVLLPERDAGNPAGKDLYERLPFSRDDRARVLELMKACRLVFDVTLPDGTEGLLVPDSLKAVSLSDEQAPAGAWTYAAEFLPEHVFLRFVARQYQVLDQPAGRCFRNRIVWNKGGNQVVLEAHYSPPGDALPFVLIRLLDSQAAVPEAVAVSVQTLFDEIYKEERLEHVRRELIQVGSPPKLRSFSRFVFRCETDERPSLRKGASKAVPRFTVVFDGVDLGSAWSSLVGLGHLHRLVRQPGRLIPVADFIRTARREAAKAYRFQQQGPPGKSESRTQPPSRFAREPTKRLKQLYQLNEQALAQVDDSGKKRQLEQYLQQLSDELERRSNPDLKRAMRSVQAELRKAVNEIKQRMKDRHVPGKHWAHFDHCASSAGHEFHFVYEQQEGITWETD